MDSNSIMYLRKGLEITEDCLSGCKQLRLELTVFGPNMNTMDTLLAKDYLKLCFNSEAPDDDILIFHNSEDKYSHNGDIRIVCHLWEVPKVLKHARKHKKVLALIKELNKRKEVSK